MQCPILLWCFKKHLQFSEAIIAWRFELAVYIRPRFRWNCFPGIPALAIGNSKLAHGIARLWEQSGPLLHQVLPYEVSFARCSIAVVQEKAGLGAAVQGFGLVFRNLRRDPSMCYRDMILECRGITRRLDLGNRRWLKRCFWAWNPSFRTWGWGSSPISFVTLDRMTRKDMQPSPPVQRPRAVRTTRLSSPEMGGPRPVARLLSRQQVRDPSSALLPQSFVMQDAMCFPMAGATSHSGGLWLDPPPARTSLFLGM